MRFAWCGREFAGPPIGQGAMAGFSVGEIRWAKRELGIKSVDGLDANEILCLYGWLAIARVDRSILPAARFVDLIPSDFEVLPHPFDPAKDGDCRDCGRPEDDGIHEGEPDPTVPSPEPTLTS